MTTDLPDPHGCPHCGFDRLAVKWGETICGMCGAPRRHAEPGCPVRNIFGDIVDVGPITAERIAAGEAAVREGRFVTLDSLRESVTAETARERRVHDGGPRINP